MWDLPVVRAVWVRDLRSASIGWKSSRRNDSVILNGDGWIVPA